MPGNHLARPRLRQKGLKKIQKKIRQINFLMVNENAEMFRKRVKTLKKVEKDFNLVSPATLRDRPADRVRRRRWLRRADGCPLRLLRRGGGGGGGSPRGPSIIKVVGLLKECSEKSGMWIQPGKKTQRRTRTSAEPRPGHWLASAEGSASSGPRTGPSVGVVLIGRCMIMPQDHTIV